MKIRYRFLYVIPLIAILLLDILFSDIITGHTYTGELSSAPSPMAGYRPSLIAACIPLSVLLYKYLRGIVRYVFWSALVGMSLLMAESYYQYGVPAVYPHVFQKIMVLFTLPAIYGVYSLVGRITLADLVGLIWVALLLNVALVNPEALSLGAFVDHERGLVASSIYLLVLPLLFHFNTYLHTKKFFHLVLFFIATAAILFFQHRTVWVVSIAALGINGLLILRTARQRLNFKVLLPLFGIPAAILFLALTTLAVSHPEILTKMAKDISDIQNHDKQGTGEWRAVQAQSYWPFIEKNPLTGMRFRGFELPIQFYMPDNPKLVVFPDGHGHFLHSYYIDSLFYLGIVGLLLLSSPQFYAIFQMVRKPPIAPEALAWSVFIATSLVYGYSYTLPPYFYGLAGFGFLRIKHLAVPIALIPPIVEKQVTHLPVPHSA